jgi:hypothetical protein
MDGQGEATTEEKDGESEDDHGKRKRGVISNVRKEG